MEKTWLHWLTGAGDLVLVSAPLCTLLRAHLTCLSCLSCPSIMSGLFLPPGLTGSTAGKALTPDLCVFQLSHHLLQEITPD